MQPLHRPTTRRGIGGTPLPTILPSLGRWHATFNRSDYSQIQGVPGAGKTPLALWHAVKWVDVHNLKGLYFAADTNQLTMTARAHSMLTGVPVDESKRLVMDKFKVGQAPEALGRLRGLEFCFDDEILISTLEDEVFGFIEKWGVGPDFIILDNLVDVETGRDDEWASIREAGKMLTKLARRTDAAAIALHHCADNEYKTPVPPRKAAMGKGSIKQALILSVGQLTDNYLPIGVVKNRDGDKDPSGERVIRVKANPDNMTFEDFG